LAFGTSATVRQNPATGGATSVVKPVIVPPALTLARKVGTNPAPADGTELKEKPQDVYHPNPLGHKEAARISFDFIMENQFVR